MFTYTVGLRHQPQCQVYVFTARLTSQTRYSNSSKILKYLAVSSHAFRRLSDTPFPVLQTTSVINAVMPNNVPEFQIANFLATNTRPIPLTDQALAGDVNIECSICQMPYADPRGTTCIQTCLAAKKNMRCKSRIVVSASTSLVGDA